jgi:hypothetical protein
VNRLGVKKECKLVFFAMRRLLSLWFVLIALTCLLSEPSLASAVDGPAASSANFPQSLDQYGDAALDVLPRLRARIAANPFNLVASVIFLLAIAHTFVASRFARAAYEIRRRHKAKIADGTASLISVSHYARLLHFLGEVEVVFGLWAVVLILAIFGFYGPATAVDYVSHKVNYSEAVFIVVIMTLAATRPVLKFAESLMTLIAERLGGSLTAWWLAIMTLGPLLGSFITEPAAITLSALLLSRKFYALEPSASFKYATLGLLFVNISVGGTMTHFAAPPVLMVAEPWGWDSAHMLSQFGWKAVLGILLSNLIYWFVFRNEFAALRERFQIQHLKEGVLVIHLQREVIEREINRLAEDVRAETGATQKLRTLIDDAMETIRQRLQQQFLESIANNGIDMAIATEAFSQRFNEIKIFRLQRELPQLLAQEDRAPFKDPNWDQREDSVPFWVTLVHVAFMAFTIINAHQPVLCIAGLLFFLGFAAVTADYQNYIDLKAPMMVGFFLAGLVTHGGLQGWWIEPVLGSLSDIPLMLTSTVLTAFNDNAAITYLSTLIPGLTDGLKYAMVAGAVTGGGLTVIANAPNPAGQAILKRHFDDAISPVGLLLGALAPTLLMLSIFIVTG